MVLVLKSMQPKCIVLFSAVQCIVMSEQDHLHQAPYFLNHITEDRCVVKIGFY